MAKISEKIGELIGLLKQDYGFIKENNPEILAKEFMREIEFYDEVKIGDKIKKDKGTARPIKI